MARSMSFFNSAAVATAVPTPTFEEERKSEKGNLKRKHPDLVDTMDEQNPAKIHQPEHKPSEKQTASLESLFKLAAQGDAEAQYSLGQYYETRAAEAKEETEDKAMAMAMEWYKKSSQQGLVKAEFALANCYRQVEDEDENTALEWYTKAAEHGLAEAQLIVSDYYQAAQDMKAAVQWITKAAQQGLAKAQYKLGNFYYLNGEGVAKDEAAAVEWVTKAAQQELIDAQYTLGCYYRFGVGVPIDGKTAVEWHKKSIDNKDKNWNSARNASFYQLAEIYRLGMFGILPSQEKALEYALHSRVNKAPYM